MIISTSRRRSSLLWAIVVFTALALGLHWGVSWLIPSALRPTVFSVGTVTPALAAALVYVLLEKQSPFSQEVRHPIWGTRPALILVGIVLVLALQAVVFAITVVVVPGSFSPAIFQQQIAHSHLRGLPTAAVVAVGVLSLTVGTMIAAVPCLGEEIGWRGFLYPRIESLAGYTGAVVIGGIIWSFWHSPEFYFLKNFNEYALPWWSGCTYFSLFTIPGGIVFYWLYRRSGSILAPTFAHAALDQSVNLMGLFLTHSKMTARITTLGGAITMIVWWLAAIVILWTSRRRTLAEETRFKASPAR